MNIQMELSLYPLRTEDLDAVIKRFTGVLLENGLSPETGVMSTMIRGESHRVFTAAARAFEACADGADVVLVCKAGNACPVAPAPPKDTLHAT